MGNRVEIVFIGVDESLSSTVGKINNSLGSTVQVSRQAGREFDATLSVFKGNVIADYFERGLTAAVAFGRGAVTAFNELKAAQAGLASEAKFRGITEDTGKVIQDLDLVKAGLLSVGEASPTLKNLLASGFGLQQSITLLNRFGDAAAFNRQSSLSFGQAITSATEGIKNQNSVLVDNAGVTKNLSVILKERGFEMQDLSDKVKGAAAREALYQGLLVETQSQVGNASQLTGTFAGKIAQLDASYGKLEVATGALITKNPELNRSIEEIGQTIDKVTAALSDPSSSVHQFFNNLISDVSVAAHEVSELVELLAKIPGLVPGGGSGNKGAGGIFRFGLFGESSPVTKARQAIEVQDELVHSGFFTPGGTLDKLLSSVLPAGSVRSVDVLQATQEAFLQQTQAQAAALLQPPAAPGPDFNGATAESVAKHLDEKAKLFDEFAQRSSKSSEDFHRSVSSFNESFASLKIKLTEAEQASLIGGQANPLLKPFVDHEERMKRIVENVGILSDGVVAKYEQMSERLRDVELRSARVDVFKEQIATLERINQLTERRIELESSTAFEDAERKRRLDFGERQASLETEIEELQRGSRFNEIEKASEAVRRLVQTPGLVGVELSKAIEEATRGLSIEQLRGGGLLHTRQDALFDIVSSERTKEAFRKRPAEVQAAEEFINSAQKEFDQAKQRAKLDPAFGATFDEVRQQQLLDATTRAVLGRISPDKLTPDLRNRELDATKRQIEAEQRQYEQRQRQVDQFGASVTKFDTSIEGLKEQFTNFAKALAAGLGLNISVTDSPSTTTQVGVAPSSLNSDNFSNAAEAGRGFLGGLGIKL